MTKPPHIPLTRRIRRFLRNLFQSRSQTSQALFDEILYVSSKTQSLDELLRVLPERICSALELSTFKILLREKNVYVLQDHSASPVSFSASSSTVSRMKRDRRPAFFVPAGAAGAEPDGWQFLAEPAELDALTALHAQVLLPLEGRTGLMGFAVLAKEEDRPFPPSELRFLRDVGPEIGRGLETAQLVSSIAQQALERANADRELEVAREVQERLLPTTLPSIAGLDIAAAYRSAGRIGGDYYDVLTMPSGDALLVIADVSGKGVPAALLMATLRASIHALSREPAQDITKMASQLNALLYNASSSSRYATLFLCQYTRSSGMFTYVNAGHNPPLLYRADGATTRLTRGGTVIGLLPETSYQSETFMLHPKDTLIAYTDGVSEANNALGEEWGEAGLEAAIGRAQTDPQTDAGSIRGTILQQLDVFVAGALQNDDITLIVVVADGA